MSGRRGGSGDDHDLLHLYLNDIGQHPLLSADDEIREVVRQVETRAMTTLRRSTSRGMRDLLSA